MGLKQKRKDLKSNLKFSALLHQSHLSRAQKLLTRLAKMFKRTFWAACLQRPRKRSQSHRSPATSLRVKLTLAQTQMLMAMLCRPQMCLVLWRQSLLRPWSPRAPELVVLLAAPWQLMKRLQRLQSLLTRFLMQSCAKRARFMQS